MQQTLGPKSNHKKLQRGDALEENPNSNHKKLRRGDALEEKYLQG